MKIPLPQGKPTNLLKLYQHYTGDLLAPEEFVKEALKTDCPQKAWILTCLMRGYRFVQIAGALGVTSRAVRFQVQRAMVRAWKLINNKPRYHKVGRKKKCAKRLIA